MLSIIENNVSHKLVDSKSDQIEFNQKLRKKIKFASQTFYIEKIELLTNTIYRKLGLKWRGGLNNLKIATAINLTCCDIGYSGIKNMSLLIFLV